MVLYHYLLARVILSWAPFHELVVTHSDQQSAYQGAVARYQIPHGLDCVVEVFSYHFDPYDDPRLYHCSQPTMLKMEDEMDIAADDGWIEDDVPILLGTLPRIVGRRHNGFPRLLALISVTACTEPPSSVVRFHYSLLLDHHARSDFLRTKKELI